MMTVGTELTSVMLRIRVRLQHEGAIYLSLVGTLQA